jgi:hypothetical protein
MHPLQIPSNAHQRPFTLDGLQTAKLELSESLYLFDDAEYRFNRGFSFCVKRFSFLGVHAMPHRLHRVGIVNGIRVFLEASLMGYLV